MVVAIVLAWALGIPLLVGGLIGVLWGIAQWLLLLIGYRKGWIPEGFWQRDLALSDGRMTKGTVVYAVGLSLTLGAIVGVANGFSATGWLIWLTGLVVIGVAFAWMLSRAT